MLRLGAPRQGMARRVMLRSGKVRQGWAGHGKARQGLTCQADGTASKAKACPGTVRYGVDKAIFERGEVCSALQRRGLLGQGTVRQALACYGSGVARYG